MGGGILVLVVLALILVAAIAMAWMLFTGAKEGAKAAGSAAKAAEEALGDDGKSDESVKRLVEPTWGRSEDGGPPLTELTAEAAGALSPFGEDHSFPLPPDRIRYAHPTDKPNRAGLMADEGR